MTVWQTPDHRSSRQPLTHRNGSARSSACTLTLVFDHAVVDGAPFGRFVRRLHEIMTRAEGLEAAAPLVTIAD